jgi:hypothetical protein
MLQKMLISHTGKIHQAHECTKLITSSNLRMFTAKEKRYEDIRYNRL